MKKLDIHNHILPETWPDFEEKFGYNGWLKVKHLSSNSNSTNCCKQTTTDSTNSSKTSSTNSCGNLSGCILNNYNDQENGYKKSADLLQGDQLFRRIESNCWDYVDRLRDMDRQGVVVQALSTVPVMFNYWAKPEDTLFVSRYLNDNLADVVRKEPRRFVGLGTLPMQAPELAAEEMKRCINLHNFPGFQIGTHVNDWNLDDRHLEPVYQVAEQHDVGLFVHPWDIDSNGRMSKYWLPWLVGMPSATAVAICSVLMGGVLQRHPRLKLCFAHGGGCFPLLRGRIQRGYDARPDLCGTDCSKNPVDFLGSFYTDSLVQDPDALQLLTKVVGEDNIILGTDYPFPLGETEAGKLIENAKFISPPVKNKMLWENGLRFLGKKEDEF